VIVNGAEVQEDKRTARPILVTDKVIINSFFLLSLLVSCSGPLSLSRASDTTTTESKTRKIKKIERSRGVRERCSTEGEGSGVERVSFYLVSILVRSPCTNISIIPNLCCKAVQIPTSRATMITGSCKFDHSSACRMSCESSLAMTTLQSASGPINRQPIVQLSRTRNKEEADIKSISHQSATMIS
jgi:hypothetical protein